VHLAEYTIVTVECSYIKDNKCTEYFLYMEFELKHNKGI
jgi:hypothetical protein